MKARIVISVLFIMTTFSCGFSQKSIVKGFLTGDQKFIVEATDSAIFIVRQDYVLRDTVSKNPQTYGRNNRPYFGRGYGIAVLAGNKLWIDNRLLKPWLIDPEYNKMQKDASLVPECSTLGIRSIKDHTYKFYPEVKSLPDIENDSLYNARGLTVLTFFNNKDGLLVNFESKDTTGWVVVAYSQTPLTVNDSCDITLAVYRDKPALNKQQQGIIKSPGQQNVIGGFYLSSSVSVGQISFKLSGLLIKKPLNWVISAIPMASEKARSPRSIITPIQKKKEETSKQSKKEKHETK